MILVITPIQNERKANPNMNRFTIHLLLTCTLSIICLHPAHAQWTQTPGPFGGTVFFLETYAGAYWAGSESGLYRSVDGQQWSRVENLGREPVVAGLADQDTLYIIRGLLRSDLLVSTDGGQSWKLTEIAEEPPTNRVSLKKTAGALIIAAITPNNYYLRSRNNGATIGFLPGGGSATSDFFDANGGLIVKGGNSPTLQISQNGGTNFFNRMIAQGFNNNYQVVVLDSAIVTRVQSNGGALSVQISFDTAQSWQALDLPAGFDPDVVTLRRSGEKGLLALIFGQYAWTTDYGANWTVFSVPEPPRELLQTGNDWLLSSHNGFYRSADAGVSWSDASAGFLGHVAYRVNTVGDKFYAQIYNASSSDFSVYVTDAGSSEWVKSTDPSGEASIYAGGEASDTLVTFNQISLDGGQTWTYITYPNVSGFSFSDIEIHNNKAYVVLGNFYIYAVPFTENPVAEVINGPTIDNLYDLLFVGDSLYAADYKGHIYLQLPNTTDWIPLTSGGPGYGGRLFHINERFFLPRWTDIRYSDDGFLFQTLPVEGLNVSPTEITTIYDMIGVDSVIIAATEMGIFFSMDKGEHWLPFDTGFPETENDYIPAWDLTVRNGVVYAAMLRQGIWQRTVAIGSSSGVVYRDDNQNGIQEPGEPPLPNTKVLGVLSENLTLTDSAGRYNLVFDLPADTVRAIAPVAYNSIQPPHRLVNGIRQNQDFGVWFQPNVTDLGISATHTAAMRPGFDNSFHLRVSNTGTVPVAATVGLRLPADVQYLGAQPAPDLVLGDSLVWLNADIPFLGSADFAVQIQLSSTIPLGTLLTFHSTVLPENTDQNSADNTFALETTVVGAYDPNDKQVWPGDHITPDDVAAGVPLRYTIRFQNTGTYPAERVRLVDTLDADLDLSTLSVLGASHPFTWQIKAGHVLEILFDQILLPDSNSNEAASHGFFSFSIAAKRALPIGTPLLNQAAIYFDYNSPIYTNTAYTQVSFESSVSNPDDPTLFLHIFPNPVSTKCTVQSPSHNGTLTLYNAAGILLQVWKDCPEQVEINMQGVVNGLYYFRWEKGRDFVIKAVVVGR